LDALSENEQGIGHRGENTGQPPGTLGNFCNFSACFLQGIGECPVLAKDMCGLNW
jgi:hypothetical protein